MRALYLDGATVRFRPDYPAPRPRANESLIRVRYAGICRTDLELARGYMGFRGVPGHEFVGEVVESKQKELSGKRVVGEINVGCGRCRWCRGGLERHCPRRTVLGIFGRDGAFADFLVLPTRNLHPVPESVPDESAVFVEPLAAAFEIFDNTNLAPTDRALVLGDGRLGALVALVLKSRGIEALVAGRHESKLSRLAGIGLKVEREDKLKPGYDVVIECTGNPNALERALALVRPRGKVVLKTTTKSPHKLNLAPLVVNEIALFGSRCGRFGPALKALAQGAIDPRPLITATFALSDGRAALKAAACPEHLKVLLAMV